MDSGCGSGISQLEPYPYENMFRNLPESENVCEKIRGLLRTEPREALVTLNG